MQIQTNRKNALQETPHNPRIILEVTGIQNSFITPKKEKGFDSDAVSFFTQWSVKSGDGLAQTAAEPWPQPLYLSLI